MTSQHSPITGVLSPTRLWPNSSGDPRTATHAWRHRHRALISHADDYMLMSPFGKTPMPGSEMTEERWQATGRFSGTVRLNRKWSYPTAQRT
jgi:hypothetical protein